MDGVEITHRPPINKIDKVGGNHSYLIPSYHLCIDLEILWSIMALFMLYVVHKYANGFTSTLMGNYEFYCLSAIIMIEALYKESNGI